MEMRCSPGAQASGIAAGVLLLSKAPLIMYQCGSLTQEKSPFAAMQNHAALRVFDTVATSYTNPLDFVRGGGLNLN
jgi:hypothetical protein